MTLSTNPAQTTEPRLLSKSGLAWYSIVLVVSVAIYLLYTAIYNNFFHPLKKIPGPFLARSSGIPYALHVRAGSIATWVKEVHEKYGDAVRLAPNEVSFTSGETAWPDIYGFRSGKYKTTGAYLKDSTWFPKPSNGVHSMLASNEADHRRVRRNLSHAFSDKALREQEQLIMQYVDLLVYRLEEHAEAGKPVDMMSWYNYATFDIICDLTFGEPLYCLRDSVEHNWIRTVIDSVQSFGPSSVKRKYPLFDYYDKAINYFADNTTSMRVRLDFLRKSQEKVTNRLEKGTSRPDFFSYVIKNMKNEGKSLSRDEMDSNAMLFLTAGSETTATALSGTTYLLLNNPDKYAKLVHEIRSKFSSADHITIEEVNKLEYMIACLQEGLRRYPPIPTAFPRVVPPGGDHISGHFIPGGTTVYVSQHATYHSSRNFKNPNKYAPERWLGDEEYKDDVRESFNPFSFGPRNCLGKNLAYAEMRLIVAKVLFNFDLELVDTTQDWLEGQKVFTLWQKFSLMVQMRPVKR